MKYFASAIRLACLAWAGLWAASTDTALPARPPAIRAKPPAQPVKVRIGWDYKGFAGSIGIHEVIGHPRLWDTRCAATLKATPVGAPIDSGILTLRPGQAKRFALVYRNESDSIRYFFAAPHVIHPVEHSLGFKFKCLCINHAFQADAGKYWYRIVEFRLSKAYVGDGMTVTHTVLGLEAAQAEAFLKDPGAAEM